MKRINDLKAFTLENKGLWRRAASRWLDVMFSSELSDEQRQWIICRRAYCLSKLPRKTRSPRFQIADVLQAARAAEIKMGLSHPCSVFYSGKHRLYQVHHRHLADAGENLFTPYYPSEEIDVISMVIKCETGDDDVYAGQPGSYPVLTLGCVP